MALAIATQPASGKIYYSRSPLFYKFTGCSASNTYVVKIYLTQGETGTLTEFMQVTRTPDLNNYIIIDFSNVILKYLKTNLSITSENTVYVKVILTENGTTNVESDICVVTMGKTEYMDGVNHAYTSTLYQMTTTPSILYLPNENTGATFQLTYCNNDAASWHINFYSTISGATLTQTQYFSNVTDAKSNIKNIPCGYQDLISTYNRNDVDQSKDMELIINNSSMAIVHSVIIKPIDTQGNDLHKLKFINKYGVWDSIFLYGKTDIINNYTNETYKFNNMNTTTMTYLKTGNYHVYNKNGRTSLKLNTGWISELLNDKIDELMDSEHVFIDDIPCIITDKTFGYKTHRWEVLINYTFNIDYAFDKNNNII